MPRSSLLQGGVYNEDNMTKFDEDPHVPPISRCPVELVLKSNVAPIQSANSPVRSTRHFIHPICQSESIPLIGK